MNHLPPSKTDLKAYGALCAAMALVGANVAIGKVLVATLPVFLFCSLRFSLASLLLLFLAAWFEPPRADLHSWEIRGLVVQSFFGVFLFTVCMLYGVAYTTATSAGIITGATPGVTALLAVVILRERLSRKSLIALILSMLGLASLNIPSLDADKTDSQWIGNLLVLAAVFCEALFTICAKHLSTSLSPLRIAAYVNLLSAFFVLPFGIAQAAFFEWTKVSATSWALALYYALTASVISVYLWYWGIRRVPASDAAVTIGILPMSAVIVGIIGLGESMNYLQAIGMVCVILAITLNARGERPA